MRRFVWWVVGLAAVVAGLVLVGMRIPAVQDFVLGRVAASRMRPRADLVEGDALRVLLCGTASPLPHPTRAKACVAVFAGGRLWIVDTGPGSWNRLGLWRVDGRDIGGVLLTHFHSDHIGDLGEFNMQTWVAGRKGPLRVFGPPGVERVVNGFMEAYALDSGYRTAHHGAELLPPAVGRMEAVPVAGPGPTVVLDDGGVKITAVAVTHTPVEPAYAYRFDWRGRSVVVSGDTVKDAALTALAKGADVLVHEAQAQHLVALLGDQAKRLGRDRVAKLMGDIPSYHTSPVEAAEVANAAGVKLLVMYHLTPPPPPGPVEGAFVRAFVRGVDAVRPEGWLVADDGLLITLPPDTQTIDVGAIE